MEYAILEGLFKLGLGLGGIVLGRLFLLSMDIHMPNCKVNAWLRQANDISKAIYYSSKLIFVAIIIGSALR